LPIARGSLWRNAGCGGRLCFCVHGPRLAPPEEAIYPVWDAKLPLVFGYSFRLHRELELPPRLPWPFCAVPK
jgi:hypothetical protein